MIHDNKCWATKLYMQTYDENIPRHTLERTSLELDEHCTVSVSDRFLTAR